MSEPIAEVGYEAGLCGHDGTNWERVLIDATKRLVVAVASMPLPTDAATATNQATVITALANLLTELQLKADLTETQPVSAASLPLPSGAATSANQTTMITALQLIDDLRAALGSVATDSLLARLYGWDTTAWQKARTDVDGYLLTRVWSSELPADAATQTTLAAVLTELGQKLETADLNLDASKDLQVDVKTMPTTTVQAGGGDKIFSFESIVEEELYNGNLSAGTNSIAGTAVASGKVWKVTNASIQYVGTSPTLIQILVRGLAGVSILLHQPSPVSGRWYIWAGDVYMQVGDYMEARVEGATATDDLEMHYSGVQMDAP